VLPLAILQGAALAMLGNLLDVPQQTMTFNALVPSMTLLLAGMVGLTALQIRTGRGLSWRMILAMSVLFLVAAEIFLMRGLFTPPATDAGGQSTAVYLATMLLPHSTWLIAVVGLTVAVVWTRGRRLRLEWEGNTTLRLPKTVDITANVVEVSDSTMKCQYSWSSFVKFEKTKRLFLLYLGPSQPIIIPKRAFANQDEVDALCAMAEAISPSRGYGFPIGQPAPAFSGPRFSGPARADPPPLPASKV
jgi:hypothetical protein